MRSVLSTDTWILLSLTYPKDKKTLPCRQRRSGSLKYWQIFTTTQCNNLVFCKIIVLYNFISFLFKVTFLIFKIFKTEFQKIS